MQRKTVEISVGLFMLAGLMALVMLAFKVSGLNQSFDKTNGYEVKAFFPNIGGLKIRSRVTLAGVGIGRVKSISIDQQSYEAVVIMFLYKGLKLPKDSSVSILTSGLIGDNYLSFKPGASEDNLQDGDVIEDTHSAVVLEELIGQFLFNRDKK